ncbi:putative bifunctional diguanylate cyclase/phosphodiesterase [Noviherbaspirillum sp. ST9]|uniref:putative bifunctional diguanylate cyclase/phosphodiesterase n=1 Tax=Noviherbaspirillum sp. ST9 TaxID=3401606 RepID=UPI003B58930B
MPIEPIAVLLVEDNPGDARLIRELLSEGAPAGVAAVVFSLRTAESLRAAIQCLQQDRFDVLLVDLSLPDSRGLETVQRILNSAPHTPIVVLTGSVDEALAMRALQAGAEDYLVKGEVDAHVLKRSIRYAIERKATRARLRDSEEKLSSILASIDNVVWSSSGHKLLYLSPVAQTVYGRPVEQFYANENLWFDIIHPDDVADVRNAAEQLPALGSMRCEYRILRPDGEVRWVEERSTAVQDDDGKISRVDSVASDITERKRHELRAEYLASHDPLTNLANRNLLADRLNQAIIHARRLQRMLALLYLDLDRFKDYNDTFGHDFGDQLLKLVASRLQTAIRAGDTVARQGGDEFIILLTDLWTQDDAVEVAAKLLEIFSVPFEIDGRMLHVTTSIGAAVYPTDAEDVSELLSNADMAMYRAKEEGGNSFQFYSGEMTRRTKERLEIGNALVQALEREEFELFYQPKVDILSGRICGMEALIRWHHPLRGLVSPTAFIPVAEETGLILAIGEWALEKACMQNKAWQKARLQPVPVSVNLSPRQFGQEGLADMVARHLEQSGLDAQYLELEVTEGVMISDPARALNILQDIRDLSVSLSLDDFGTGYSSLAYLQRFPFAKLKIDSAFVADITSNTSNAAITLAIIDIAHRLNLRVVAEGVETEAQLSYLRHHLCDEIQGFYFSEPVPAAKFEQMLRDGNELSPA